MVITFLLLGVVLGSMVILFSISPYFGIFGVLLQSVRLSGLLCFFGSPLISLLLIVIYIGGMLVVFLFSRVLCAEPYPEIDGFKVALCFLGLFILVFPLITM